jgi:hypothetical protein
MKRNGRIERQERQNRPAFTEPFVLFTDGWDQLNLDRETGAGLGLIGLFFLRSAGCQ